LSNSITRYSEYKRKYSLSELYLAYIFVPGALASLMANKKSKSIDQQFVERIMLAVTEVNGCAACSYAHTKMALKQGISREEIISILNGEKTFVKAEEAKAIMFAQHFADSRGYPDKEAFEVIVKEYGAKKARIILSAAQVMIVGNMYGLPFSALLSRRKGKAYKDSSLGFELGMLIFGALVIPVALLHALLRWLVGRANVSYIN